jgi:hypothetical protein
MIWKFLAKKIGAPLIVMLGCFDFRVWRTREFEQADKRENARADERTAFRVPVPR